MPNDHSIKQDGDKQSMAVPLASAGWRRRAPFYALAMIAGLVVAAYIDGGEEPLHPIVQQVNVPPQSGPAQSGDAR